MKARLWTTEEIFYVFDVEIDEKEIEGEEESDDFGNCYSPLEQFISDNIADWCSELDTGQNVDPRISNAEVTYNDRSYEHEILAGVEA